MTSSPQDFLCALCELCGENVSSCRIGTITGRRGCLSKFSNGARFSAETAKAFSMDAPKLSLPLSAETILLVRGRKDGPIDSKLGCRVGSRDPSSFALETVVNQILCASRKVGGLVLGTEQISPSHPHRLGHLRRGRHRIRF